MSKILLVEDNPDAVKRIIRYINKIFAELDVVSFPEAGDALQYAKANDISLFILDIQLEDYKGTNLAKQLRELPEYKYTPIIFETALAGEEDPQSIPAPFLPSLGSFDQPLSSEEYLQPYQQPLLQLRPVLHP